ncbi:unnamed protein product [Rotaria sp. Silwood1]|nr:unnamed protein product [Rotaria sp. Silwood1]CAF4577801.1 unnamed protein product [Rotaria sp. Silwood1]
MASTTEELQKYVGQSFKTVKQELESQGYRVHEIRLGPCTIGGNVLVRPCVVGKPEPVREKRAVVSYRYEDPEEKVTDIRRQDY